MAHDVLLTLGHSNRGTERFLALLAAHGVTGLVDIRRYPGSRRHPHMARRPLAASLTAAGVAYAHLPELGGHREARDDSPHVGLDPSWRGYADHMASDEFARGLARVALMCAEAEPSQCHRRLLSDHLVVAGVDVRHAVDEGPPIPHRLSPEARVREGRLDYGLDHQGQLPGL